MAFRYEDPERFDAKTTDARGGEDQPRPHRAQRLMDLLDGDGEESSRRRVSTSEKPVRTGGRKGRAPTDVPSERERPRGNKTSAPKPSRKVVESVSASEEEDPLKRAIQKGLDILTRGDLSARRLAEKLMEKGYDRDTALHATRYLLEKGDLRERETACRFAEQGMRKGWGPRRISEDLRAKGFAPKALQSALDSLEDVDWVKACLLVMTKRYGAPPEDAHGRQKLTAALFRLGYDPETVRSAMERAMRDSK